MGLPPTKTSWTIVLGLIAVVLQTAFNSTDFLDWIGWKGAIWSPVILMVAAVVKRKYWPSDRSEPQDPPPVTP